LKKRGYELPFANTVIYSVSFTTLCWLVAAFVAPGTDALQLVAFYQKVRPSGPGWKKIRRAAGVSDAASHGDHMGKAALGWVSGCAAIWSSLFAVGNFLYGRMNYALPLLGVFIVSGLVLVYVVNTLWSGGEKTK
jgi:solute:Na+ symporter, SSS family